MDDIYDHFEDCEEEVMRLRILMGERNDEIKQLQAIVDKTATTAKAAAEDNVPVSVGGIAMEIEKVDEAARKQTKEGTDAENDKPN